MVGGRYIPDPAGAEFEQYVLGTSGPARGRQREILRLRRAAISSAITGSQDNFTISDFWLAESFALAEVIEPTLETAHIKLLKWESGVMSCRPKLLVVIGYRFPGAEFFGDAPKYDRALMARAKTADSMPPLILPTVATEAVAEEVVAAVRAMQK
jgi:hypothetical protein